MFKKILELMESIPATIIGGVCLLASFLIPVIFDVELPLYLDPAWIAVIVSGVPLLCLAIRRVVCNRGIRKISSALLISVAMIAAICIGDLFAAGEVAFIMAIGELLEDKTTERAKKGLKKLISLAPVQGRRMDADGETMIAVEEIRVGDILRVLPGETVPVDGVIVSGETSIDQSIMTGEALPVDKSVGDEVFCGTINRFGAIDMRATKVGEDASLQKMIRMVEDAEEKQAPMQRIADQWASWLVPVALLLAVIAGLIRQDLVVAVTVLVVFCPCALVLATPTAIMAAIGQATRHGVIIKSGEALEKMGKINTIAFDKTGTLTAGKPVVSNVLPISEETNAEALLFVAASAEQKSEHPLGKAIVAYAKEKSLALSDAEAFRMEAGKGIMATVDGKQVLCGNEAYMSEHRIGLPDTAKQVLGGLRDEGKASVVIAVNGEVIGIIALSDTLRPDAAQMIDRLHVLRTNTVLLTGDNARAANYFAKQVGVTDIKAELLPADKVACVETMQQNGELICMIGDGVNDAPALKTADVGIAMGTMGSDIAVEAADIALVGDDLSKIPYLKRLSKATLNTIRLSITLSLVINFAAIALSFFGLLNPTTGALVHNAGSVFVVLIAALLYDRKF